VLTVKVKRLLLLLKPIIHTVEFESVLMVVLVGLDQWSKQWFQMKDLVVFNTGGVLGILPDFWWLWGLLFVWLGLLHHWLGYQRGWYRFGLLLILTGGLGNLIDRLLFGSVRDFIYYPVLGFYGNLADIFLVVGVFICLVTSLLLQYKPCQGTQSENHE
jgi:lipoprotein signal peptidase